MFERARAILEGGYEDRGIEAVVFGHPDRADRVVKMPFPELLVEFRSELWNVSADFNDTKRVYEKALDEGAHPETFGNPKFEEGYWTQDLVKTWEDAYREANGDQKRELIERSAGFTEKCITEYGFYDSGWNFHGNQGLQDGRMVQMDPGEIEFSREGFVESVQKEEYRKGAFYVDFLREEDERLYHRRMQEIAEDIDL